MWVIHAVKRRVRLGDSSPFVGKWRFNKAQSKLPPGEVMPGDMVADFSRVDSAHVRWSVTVTDAQGRPMVQSFDAPANGEFYPVSGDTTAAFNLTEIGPPGHVQGAGGRDGRDDLRCVDGSSENDLQRGADRWQRQERDVQVDVYDRS